MGIGQDAMTIVCCDGRVSDRMREIGLDPVQARANTASYDVTIGTNFAASVSMSRGIDGPGRG